MSNTTTTTSTVKPVSFLAALTYTSLKGGTIDDLMVRYHGEESWNSWNSDEKFKKIASMNVKKSLLRKQVVTQREDMLTALNTQLENLGNDTSDDANAIREKIRQHNAETPKLLQMFDLSRRSRTGERQIVDFSAALADAVLESAEEIASESAE